MADKEKKFEKWFIGKIAEAESPENAEINSELLSDLGENKEQLKEAFYAGFEAGENSEYKRIVTNLTHKIIPVEMSNEIKEESAKAERDKIRELIEKEIIPLQKTIDKGGAPNEFIFAVKGFELLLLKLKEVS